MEDDRDLHRQARNNRVEGTKDELKGKVRGGLGDMTDDHSQHARGKLEEWKGKAQRKVGEIQSDLADERDRQRSDSRDNVRDDDRNI